MTRWGQQCRAQQGFEISTGYEVGKYDSISVGPSYRVKEGSNAFWSFVSCTQLAVLHSFKGPQLPKTRYHIPVLNGNFFVDQTTAVANLDAELADRTPSR
jgi:hypothetical protein